MEREPVGTKRDLILAAGELFAENGLDGTGIRAIAEKAGANVAAINYHFGSKANLYKETLLYAARQGAGMRAVEWVQDGGATETPEAAADAIEQIVKEWFEGHFLAEDPPWRSRLFVRSMAEPAELLEPAVAEVFRPDTEALMAIFRTAKPDLTEDEALLWAYGLIGQFTFYMFAHSAVLTSLERDEYDQAFLDAAAAHIAAATLRALGLPTDED